MKRIIEWIEDGYLWVISKLIDWMGVWSNNLATWRYQLVCYEARYQAIRKGNE